MSSDDTDDDMLGDTGGTALPPQRRAAAKADSAEAQASRALEKVTELAQRVDELTEDVSRLEQQLDEQETAADLIRSIGAADQLSTAQRAAVLVQTLVNTAERRDRNGRQPTAMLDWNGAENALGGDISRTQIYRAMSHADEHTDTDAVQFIEEDRSSDQNTRLVVDLSEYNGSNQPQVTTVTPGTEGQP